jgi:hypothetical protein
MSTDQLDRASLDAVHHAKVRPPNIADAYTDLLYYLDPMRRRGLIARLAIGYYEGWRPSHNEMADLVAIELGILTLDEYTARGRARRLGRNPVSIVGRLREQDTRRLGRQWEASGPDEL